MYKQYLKPLLARHAKEIIESLVHHQLHFYLQCDVSKVQFDPILPADISDTFRPIIDFILAGYTFESIEIWENEISFEAGFGKDNFASVVIVPFSAIIQLAVPTDGSIVRDACLFMNAISLFELDIYKDKEQPKHSQSIDIKEEEDELLASSKQAILSNPHNQFLKH
ncbi:hypothetical protein [Helicobacter sp. MIT 14-3879]|uniref:hypothetical protein n=1 Tax=Helicobacter sp. MIT 14-3879 TaxID=2040649 RepID=UPI000E1F0D77|nr:hypothetical protein [Helicobacter sp. MIT 14-3879]RDU61330.1 hypothetical protein CQA44_09330 [Helicobacter sp. MIT 14-3879]